VITNILGISLGSYSDELIKGNIFTWFNQDFIYRDLASKGYFMYANQISCLLVVLIPFITYFYLQNKLKLYYLIILMLSLLMLGTRVANIGSVLVLFVIVSLYLLFCILKKEKLERKKVVSIFFIIVLYAFLLPFSPTIGRDNIYEYILKENNGETLYASNNDELLTDINYIKDNYEKKLINKEFITRSYPYQYDPSFWLNILNEPEENRADYRFLEISMVKRVIEINNNKLDLWFGITNSRIQNIFNIERDYILQYYAFGLIGFILLIGIYFIIFIKNIINLIKNFNFYNVCLVSSFALFFIIAYMSGNIMNQISIFVPLLFIICQNMNFKV
ncbi:MAG: O-antigen ligase family protein, partial [Clostridia bacterium]